MQTLHYCFCCILSVIVSKAQDKEMTDFSISEWEGKGAGGRRIKIRPPTQSCSKSTIHMHDHDFSIIQEKP